MKSYTHTQKPKRYRTLKVGKIAEKYVIQKFRLNIEISIQQKSKVNLFYGQNLTCISEFYIFNTMEVV